MSWPPGFGFKKAKRLSPAAVQPKWIARIYSACFLPDYEYKDLAFLAKFTREQVVKKATNTARLYSTLPGEKPCKLELYENGICFMEKEVFSL
ncbi:MAG: hypothetical protein DRN17_08370 [Thermoplasmata archaeon]|nr:MAG: hypothetical protein DRN17_08370 [Thermoplasmata archaeon]